MPRAARRPFDTVDPPAEAWMVAGGVGLAPFATLGDALSRAARRRRCFTARAPVRALRPGLVHVARHRLVSPEDGTTGERGASRPLERELDRSATSFGASRSRIPVDIMIYAAAQPMLEAVAHVAARSDGHRRSQSTRDGMRHGGCYSCVIPVVTRRPKALGLSSHDGRASPVRFRGEDVVWD